MQKILLKNYQYLNDTQVKNYYHFLQVRLSKALQKMANPITIDVEKFEFFSSLLELFNNLILEKDNLLSSEQKKKKKKFAISFNPYKFLYFNINEFFIEPPEFTSRECLENGYTYNARILIESKFYDDGTVFKKISNQLTKNFLLKSKEKKNLFFQNFWFKQKHLLCHLPFLTEEGTFIINGCERVIINQLIRSPGIYFLKEKYNTDWSKHFYNAYIISEKGKWTKITLLELENSKPRVGIEINQKKLGEIWTAQALTLFGMDDGYRDGSLSLFYLLNEFGINVLELFSMIQTSNISSLSLISDDYKKLGKPIKELPSSFDLTKLIFFENFKKFLDLNKKAFNGTTRFDIKRLFFESFLDEFYNPQYGSFLIGEAGRLQINEKLGIKLPTNIDYITPIDLIGILNGLIGLSSLEKKSDDIDHMNNKKARSAGDLFAYHISAILSKPSFLKSLETPVKYLPSDQKTSSESVLSSLSGYNLKNESSNFNFSKIQKLDSLSTKKSLKIHYLIDSSIAEFCTSSPLVQLTQLANQLSLLNQKRKFSLLGPGGLKADQVSVELRDIHPSKYSKICYIETADGPRVGLVSSLSLVAQMNTQGLLEAPYFFGYSAEKIAVKNYIYLNANKESKISIEVSRPSRIVETSNQKVTIKKDCNFLRKKKEDVNFFKISPAQTLSVGISLVPFLEHDDATRVLMGSNMQRQAVPLVFPQKPIVGTGIETNICTASGMCLRAYSEGVVTYADNYKIKIKDLNGQEIVYPLKKYKKAYQDTTYNQKSCVWNFEKIFSGQIIADGPGSLEGELSLGVNLTVAYMPWYGYNYEDAIVISSKILENNTLTSLHISEHDISLYELEAYKYDFLDTKKKDKGKKQKKKKDELNEAEYNYPEQMSRNVFQSNPYLRRNLNSFGLIKIGAYVQKNDILLGKLKIIPTNNTNPYIRLLNAILKKDKNEPLMKDVSIRMEGPSGRVIAIKAIDRDFLTGSEKYDSSLLKLIKIYTIQTKKIEVGDKLSGRHGNKGVISKILPKADMPYLPDGSPIDIILNPLGVPSRMNVGQLFETTLGLAGYNLGKRYTIDCFDEFYSKEASRLLIDQKLKQASFLTNSGWLYDKNLIGKICVRDGRTGEYFDNLITVGKSYILKLVHLVEDKIHARATGSYSLINEQPLAGRASNGGQRFGEMEVWAMEAYGASYTLQELLTIKSDDYDGRNDIYESLASKKKLIKPNINVCESYITLIRHLNSIGLNFSFKVIGKKKLVNQEIFDSLEKRLKLRALVEKKEIETRSADFDGEVCQKTVKEVQEFYQKINSFFSNNYDRYRKHCYPKAKKKIAKV